MTDYAEKLITAAMTILLGIVSVAFLVAIVSNKSNSPAVISSMSGGFACALGAAMGYGNQCGSGVSSVVRGGGLPTGTANSGVNYGCTTVEGVQYCP